MWLTLLLQDGGEYRKERPTLFGSTGSLQSFSGKHTRELFRTQPDGSSEDSESQVAIKGRKNINTRRSTYTKVDKPIQKDIRIPSPVHISPTPSSTGKSPSPTFSYKSQHTLKNEDPASPVQTGAFRRSPSPVDRRILRKTNLLNKRRSPSPPSSELGKQSPSPTFKTKSPSPSALSKPLKKISPSSSHNIFRRSSSSAKAAQRRSSSPDQKTRPASSQARKRLGFFFMGHSTGQ